MPKTNSEKNVANQYFAMKNTLFFCKDNFLNICCLDIFLKINLRTETGQQPAKFMKILFMHSTSANGRHFLPSTF